MFAVGLGYGLCFSLYISVGYCEFRCQYPAQLIAIDWWLFFKTTRYVLNGLLNSTHCITTHNLLWDLLYISVCSICLLPGVGWSGSFGTLCICTQMSWCLFCTVKLPKPLANRDFVTQRSWQDNGLEKLIVNHSVSHKVLRISWTDSFSVLQKKFCLRRTHIQSLKRGSVWQ